MRTLSLIQSMSSRLKMKKNLNSVYNFQEVEKSRVNKERKTYKTNSHLSSNTRDDKLKKRRQKKATNTKVKSGCT